MEKKDIIQEALNDFIEIYEEMIKDEKWSKIWDEYVYNNASMLAACSAKIIEAVSNSHLQHIITITQILIYIGYKMKGDNEQ